MKTIQSESMLLFIEKCFHVTLYRIRIGSRSRKDERLFSTFSGIDQIDQYGLFLLFPFLSVSLYVYQLLLLRLLSCVVKTSQTNYLRFFLLDQAINNVSHWASFCQCIFLRLYKERIEEEKKPRERESKKD